MNRFEKFLLMVEALGDKATDEQGDRLLSWVIQNLPRSQWGDAAVNAIGVGDFYTDMRERMGECGVY